MKEWREGNTGYKHENPGDLPIGTVGPIAGLFCKHDDPKWPFLRYGDTSLLAKFFNTEILELKRSISDDFTYE